MQIFKVQEEEKVVSEIEKNRTSALKQREKTVRGILSHKILQCRIGLEAEPHGDDDGSLELFSLFP